MKRIIKRFPELVVTDDSSAYYIEDEDGNVIKEFPKQLPIDENGVMLYATNEEVWLEVQQYLEQMDANLNL
jgi:hypothetical protein